MMPWVIAKASPTEPIAVQCFKTWAGKIYIDSYRFYLQHEILPPVVSLLSLQDHQIDPNRISKCPTLKANARPAECILRFCEPISKSPTFLLGWISWNFHFHWAPCEPCKEGDAAANLRNSPLSDRFHLLHWPTCLIVLQLVAGGGSFTFILFAISIH